MAKSRGIWAELQRERANRQRLEQQASRAAAQAAERTERQRDRARRDALRQAAASERDRKRLYIADRKAEAVAMAAGLRNRAAELDSVLAIAITKRPEISFASLKHTVELPPFNAGRLAIPAAEPSWDEFAPPVPGALGRMLGGRARFERDEAAARDAYERALAQHDAVEAERHARLAERRRSYDQHVADELEAASAHNDAVDQFERAFCAADPEAVAQFFTLVLDTSAYPDGFPHRTRALYRPEPGEVVVEYELPPQSVMPVEKDYRYAQTRDEIDAVARPVKEIKDGYARLIAKVALRTIHEVFGSDPEAVATVVTFNGHVSTTALSANLC